MSALIHERCVLHQDREAAVLCPGCRRFYCRECVTEHAGRMICAHCVAQSESPEGGKRFRYAAWAAMSLAGSVFAWLLIYYLGIALAQTSASFHGGTP